MAYLALYRKWRPQVFSDVVGQDHVVRTLLNSLLNNRVSHAYLFCGPRGTGKTSIAKILARAVNCRELQEGNPCGKCEPCLEIEAGTCMDVVEIDAASHRGINEVREIREQVRFSPSSGEKRVFIIDEVHMLTNEAFNALLKTLEEPPAHGLFILATTEPHQLPLTILSRCQRFDFHQINDTDMIKRLKQVVAGAGIAIEPPALDLIVKASDGAMRDALGILDQAAAYGGNTIGVKEIHDLLGTVQEEVLENLARALMESEAGKVLELVDQTVEQGKDLRVFLKEVNGYLHNILLRLIETKAQGIDSLANIIRLLSSTEQEMRWSTQPRVVLEVALIKAARSLSDRPTEDSKIAQLSARINELEVRLSRLSAELPLENIKIAATNVREAAQESLVKTFEKNTVVQETKIPTPSIAARLPAESPGVTPEAKELKEVKEVKETGEINDPDQAAAGPEQAMPEPELLGKIDSRWNDILDMARRVYPNIASQLTQGKGWPLALESGTLTIGFPQKHPYTMLAMGVLDTETNLKEIAVLLKSVCQVDLRIRLTASDKKPPSRNRKSKKTVQPEDVERAFGESKEVYGDSFNGFDD